MQNTYLLHRGAVALCCVWALATTAFSAPNDTVNGHATIKGSDFTAELDINAKEGKKNGSQGHLVFTRGNEGFEGDVTYANISGNTAWVALRIGKATNQDWVGRWVFMKIVDGGEPHGQDWVWMGLADENSSVTGVIRKLSPTDGPYLVTKGNLHVHSH